MTRFLPAVQSSLRPNFSKSTNLLIRGGEQFTNHRYDRQQQQKLASNYDTIDDQSNEVFSRSIIPNLFQLSDDIKSAASKTSKDDDKVLRRPTGNLDSSRGGALVQQTPNGILSERLDSVDTTQVDSFKTQFLPGDKSQDLSATDVSPLQLSTPTTFDGSMISSLSSAKSFWLNTWAANFPDDKSEVPDKNKNSNLNDSEQQQQQTIEPFSQKKILSTLSPSHLKIESDISDFRKAGNSDNSEFDDGVTQTKGSFSSDGSGHVVQKQADGRPETSSWFDANVEELVVPRHTPDMIAKDASPLQSGRDSLTAWTLYKPIRRVRKTTAKFTGLHGFASGKYRQSYTFDTSQRRGDTTHRTSPNRMFASIKTENDSAFSFSFRERTRSFDLGGSIRDEIFGFVNARDKQRRERLYERKRKERLKEIDHQMQASQQRLMELACERDYLTKHPNPLWNYTVDENQQINRTLDVVASERLVNVTRQFNFPTPDLVENYLDMLFSTGRIVKMNHTALWHTNGNNEQDNIFQTYSYFGASARPNKKKLNTDAPQGSWFLRNGIGGKISETAESSAYKAVCQSIMSILARSLSAIHGVNVMGFSEIRLSMEQTPSLPPLPGINKRRDHASIAVSEAMQRGALRRHQKRTTGFRSNGPNFIQLDAVVENLLRQCQLAAPLMKVFPLAWQWAILENIVILITAIVADFCEGVEFHILGHRLSFAFIPITEDDLLKGLHDRLNNEYHRPDPARFEAAVLATAAEIDSNLKFLDRWHERVLGGGLLRTQIATLIARLVLTVIDDILKSAKLSLWESNAGGPRLTSRLDYG